MTDLENLASSLAVGLGLLRRRLRQLPTDVGATLPEVSALARLQRGGPATNAELAKTEQISPQSMSTTMAALESRGLVTRTSDPGDGRRVLLSIADAGVATLEAQRATRHQQLAAALADLPDEDIATLRAAAPVLERLAQAL